MFYEKCLMRRFDRVVPDYAHRCKRCGGGPVLGWHELTDRCLNCHNYFGSEPLIDFDLGETLRKVGESLARWIKKTKHSLSLCLTRGPETPFNLPRGSTL